MYIQRNLGGLLPTPNIPPTYPTLAVGDIRENLALWYFHTAIKNMQSSGKSSTLFYTQPSPSNSPQPARYNPLDQKATVGNNAAIQNWAPELINAIDQVIPKQSPKMTPLETHPVWKEYHKKQLEEERRKAEPTVYKL
jgi:hypothetical protein